MSGNVNLSIFPKAGLAARLKITPTDNTYIQGAVYDGDPATRGFRAGEGKLYIAEAGLSSDTGTYKLGYWKHTAALTFGANNFANDYGVYAVVDQELMHFADDSAIGWFAQYGVAPKDRNTVYSYMGTGVHMHGLIPTRAEDDLGVAIAIANTHTSATAANVAETAVELTYRVVATPWLAIQPSLQRIQNPGGDAAAPTVNAGLLRFEIAL